jgi:hypothetical protein
MIQIPPEWKEKTNCEIARLLGVTAQAVLYARRREAGKCLRCGRKADAGVQYCQKHRKAVNASNRTRNGHKPWKPGGKGRPPIVREQEAAA